MAPSISNASTGAISGKGTYTELKNICVWSKANAGMGSFYRSQHKFVCVFKSGNAPHINNIELGKHGRCRANIWTYAGVNSFGDGRSDLELHPTVKPVAMVAARRLSFSLGSKRCYCSRAYLRTGDWLVRVRSVSSMYRREK
jgi:hypothetical protein